MGRLLAWAAAALSGALLALSFPPLGYWPLAWVALVPLFAAVRRCPDAKSAANLGAFAGLIFYSASLSWLVKVFGPMAAAFWCLFALWIGLHAALMQRLARRGDLLWTAAAGVLWVGIEYFRCEVWRLNCSWLALGYSQTPNLPILQFCSLFGIYGLSFMIVAVNAGAALLLEGRRKPAAACAAIAAAAMFWGSYRLGHFKTDAGAPLKVALVQDESYDLNRLAKLSLSPEALGADLLVWPEYAFTVTAGQEKAYISLLAKKLKGSKAVAVVGGAIFPEDMKRGREENFAWVLSPQGALIGRYDKLHPIPYVEKLLPPNPDPHPVKTPLGVLGIQICYDLDFEDGTRTMVREGARILVVPNIDPFEWGVRQHLMHSAMSPVRAVESGLWIVRAASSGFSQIIDPAGRIVAALDFGKSGVLAGTARLTEPGTFYSGFGWLLAPLCFGLACAVLAAAAVAALREHL